MTVFEAPQEEIAATKAWYESLVCGVLDEKSYKIFSPRYGTGVPDRSLITKQIVIRVRPEKGHRAFDLIDKDVTQRGTDLTGLLISCAPYIIGDKKSSKEILSELEESSDKVIIQTGELYKSREFLKAKGYEESELKQEHGLFIYEFPITSDGTGDALRRILWDFRDAIKA